MISSSTSGMLEHLHMTAFKTTPIMKTSRCTCLLDAKSSGATWGLSDVQKRVEGQDTNTILTHVVVLVYMKIHRRMTQNTLRKMTKWSGRWIKNQFSYGILDQTKTHITSVAHGWSNSLEDIKLTRLKTLVYFHSFDSYRKNCTIKWR